jgi:hypothetical protein
MAKAILFLSGIDISKFSAHSFHGASTSKALGAGVSLKDILETANKKQNCFSHLAKVQEVTALNVLKETNNLSS